MRPKLRGPVHHNIMVGTLKMYICISHIEQMLRLPGAVALYISLITLTVLEVLGTKNWVTSNLLFQLDPSNIVKIQS